MESLQARLHIKEVQLNPHIYEDLTGVQQRRQQKPTHPRFPDEIKLPFTIYQASKNNNSNYVRFRELISSGNIKSEKEIKDKLIKAYKAKVQVRQTELHQAPINIDDMLGEIEDLHMGPMDLATEVSMDKEYNNVDIKLYPNVVPAISPNLNTTSLKQVINCRCLVKTTSSYIVTDSVAEMFTLGAGWLITKIGSMPSINTAGSCQQMGQNI